MASGAKVMETDRLVDKSRGAYDILLTAKRSQCLACGDPERIIGGHGYSLLCCDEMASQSGYKGAFLLERKINAFLRV